MPALIGVNEFVDETRDDYNSPTTSTFVSRMGQCRHTIASLEEVIFTIEITFQLLLPVLTYSSAWLYRLYYDSYHFAGFPSKKRLFYPFVSGDPFPHLNIYLQIYLFEFIRTIR